MAHKCDESRVFLGESGGFSLTSYLELLREWVLKTDAKTVVELGVGEGHSTLILLGAVIENGGHLISVDVQPCPTAHRRIVESRLDLSHWTFIQMDDLELAKFWSKAIDLLYIDSSHLYEHTLLELQTYSGFVEEVGAILLHDTLHTPENNPSEKWDVKRAVDDFVKEKVEWQFIELLPDDEGECGLGLLVRRLRLQA